MSIRRKLQRVILDLEDIEDEVTYKRTKLRKIIDSLDKLANEDWLIDKVLKG